MKGLFEDFKHALRLYRRTPGASLMVIAVLAIGMAFVTAFLSLYSDLILRPEPGFEPGNRIVSVGWNDGRNAGGLPIDLIKRIAAESTTLEKVAGTATQQFLIGTEKETGIGELVTSEFFPGVRPKLALGRGFTAEEHDERGEPVVVISWRYWQEHYAGRPDVLGKTLEIERPGNQSASPQANSGAEEPPKDFRIIGVMARDFAGTLPPQSKLKTAFWMPVERGLPIALPLPAQFRAQLMSTWTMRGVARRAAHASNEAVLRELAGRFSDEQFIKRPGAHYEVIDRIVQNVFIQRETQRQLQLFLGASVLLALVAAANVSLFLLARAPGRRRELGIRMAVGAPLKRLARQLAGEAAVLVLAAAALGLVLSIWLAKFLRGLPFLRQAQWRDVTLLDWRVLALVGVFLLVVTLLVSLAPILGLKKLGIAASSRLVAARATVGQRIAGTAQIAVAGTLGGAAIAFAWHLTSMLLADPGYRTKQLYAASYSIIAPGGQIRIHMQDGKPVVDGIVDTARRREAFAAVPGVTSLSLAGAVPGVDGGSGSMTLPDPKKPDEPVRVRSLMIDAQYVELLGLKLLYGRNLRENDDGVLVNQAFARRFFGRDDVVGEPMPMAVSTGAVGVAPTQATAFQIVGVLKDVSYGHPLADIDPTTFTNSGLSLSGVVLVESTLAASALQKQFQEVARKLELNMNGNVLSLSQARSDVLAPDRARGFLTIATAVLVVLLAAFGFYGTQRYLVSAGRREYAIRASLGAGPRALGRLVLKRGLLLGLPGLVLGLPLAFVLVAWLRDDYVKRSISPLVVTIAVAALLVALLLVASLGPARLARRTQPAPLLRED